jgi:hypothetical protein
MLVCESTHFYINEILKTNFELNSGKAQSFLAKKTKIAINKVTAFFFHSDILPVTSSY